MPVLIHSAVNTAQWSHIADSAINRNSLGSLEHSSKNVMTISIRTQSESRIVSQRTAQWMDLDSNFSPSSIRHWARTMFTFSSTWAVVVASSTESAGMVPYDVMSSTVQDGNWAEAYWCTWWNRVFICPSWVFLKGEYNDRKPRPLCWSYGISSYNQFLSQMSINPWTKLLFFCKWEFTPCSLFCFFLHLHTYPPRWDRFQWLC